VLGKDDEEIPKMKSFLHLLLCAVWVAAAGGGCRGEREDLPPCGNASYDPSKNRPVNPPAFSDAEPEIFFEDLRYWKAQRADKWISRAVDLDYSDDFSWDCRAIKLTFRGVGKDNPWEGCGNWVADPRSRATTVEREEGDNKKVGNSSVKMSFKDVGNSEGEQGPEANFVQVLEDPGQLFQAKWFSFFLSREHPPGASRRCQRWQRLEGAEGS
jgi:hypothetical protein